jgi:hypothetical protein
MCEGGGSRNQAPSTKVNRVKLVQGKSAFGLDGIPRFPLLGLALLIFSRPLSSQHPCILVVLGEVAGTTTATFYLDADQVLFS